MKGFNATNTTLTAKQVEEIVSWVPLHFRFGTWAHCFYCGEEPTAQDHVIPWSMLNPDVRRGNAGGKPGIKTPCCHECNCLLGSSYFETLYQRCEYVNKKIRRRYSKYLHMESWDDWELRELNGKLRGYVTEKQKERTIAFNRATWQTTEEYTKMFHEASEQAKVEYPENTQLHAFMIPAWVT